MEPALSILRPGSYEEAAEMLAGGSACRIVGGDTKRWGRPAHTAGPAISSERLNHVLEHNTGDFTAVVQAGIPLVADKENFHKNVGDEVNVLYVDGHVTRELTFIADP